MMVMMMMMMMMMINRPIDKQTASLGNVYKSASSMFQCAFFLFKMKIEFILCLISGQAAVGVKSFSSQPFTGKQLGGIKFNS